MFEWVLNTPLLSSNLSEKVKKFTASDQAFTMRIGHPEVFRKKSVLKNFARFTESTCGRVSFVRGLQLY